MSTPQPPYGTPDRPADSTPTVVDDGTTVTTADRPATTGGRRRGGITGVVTIIGVLVLALLVIQGGAAASWGNGRPHSGSYSAAVDDISRIDIDISRATLTTTFGDVPEATLDITSTGWRAEDPWTFEVDGDRLVVSDRRQAWFLPFLGSRGVTAELTLPRDLEGTIDLEMDLAAGDVDVLGDYRQVDVQVAAGSAAFEGASTTLTVDVSAGDATIVTSGPESVDVEVSAGRVTADVTGTPPGSTVVDVSAGDVHLYLPDGDYAVSGEVSAGDRSIDVRTDPAAAATLQVDVSAGDATVAYGD